MKTFNVLFLCTGNSARSILAEALATTLSHGKLIGYSAGSHPNGKVNPIAEELALEMGYPKEKLRSKSWDEFANPNAPQMDFIITVCDNAKGEVCPVWIGHPAQAHWGFPDPAAVEGTYEEKKKAFIQVMNGLKMYIETLLELPLDDIDRMNIETHIKRIPELHKL
jgi:protein-tyrosine-phosphatase